MVAYRTLAGSSALDADAAALARHFGDQEQAHLDAVSKQLQTLGGVVPGEPAAGHGQGRARVLDRVAHPGAAPRPSPGRWRPTPSPPTTRPQRSLRRAEFLQTTAAIMANEGQHLALLREALHREPVPNAFETGQP